MSNQETVLQQNIRLALGQHTDLRYFATKLENFQILEQGDGYSLVWQRVVLTLLVLKLSRLLLR